MRRSLLILLHLVPLAAGAAISTGFQSEARMAIASGVVFERGFIVTTPGGRQAVYIVRANPAEGSLRFEASMSNERIAGLETTTAQANRKNSEGHRAVAAINGDFFDPQQSPFGMHIQNGELFADGPKDRATFGVRNAKIPRVGFADVAAAACRTTGTCRPLTRVNQTRTENDLVLYTPRFGVSTPTTANGSEAVLTGFALPLQPTGVYRATVKEVRTKAGATTIGAGEVVLSGEGDGVDFVESLRPGETLTFNFVLATGWEGATEAVAGPNIIVLDGAVGVDPYSRGFADITHPRSAIGTTEAGEVILVAVDGRQPGYSTGVTLDELGELLLSLGATRAMNLDGGGSTTLAVRMPGDDRVTMVNRGSDGVERAVGNSILVFSTAPTGPAQSLVLRSAGSKVLAGTRVPFTAVAVDAAMNRVSGSPPVTWSSSAGSIGADGVFTATAPGSVTITARSGELTRATEVSVVGSLSSLAIEPASAIVAPGGTQRFTLVGRDEAGDRVVVDPSLGAWRTVGTIGTIGGDGTLRAASQSRARSGYVEAGAAGLTARARVDIGKPPVILEDFEDQGDIKAHAIRAEVNVSSAMRPNPVHNGTRSLKVAYELERGQPSIAGFAHTPLCAIESRPLKVGLWVWGDGSRHQLRGQYRDGNGAQRGVDFTSAPASNPSAPGDCAQRTGGIDWNGWKYVEAPIPPNVALPLKWENVAVVEPSDRCDNSSTIYLDDLRAVYFDRVEDR